MVTFHPTSSRTGRANSSKMCGSSVSTTAPSHVVSSVTVTWEAHTIGVLSGSTLRSRTLLQRWMVTPSPTMPIWHGEPKVWKQLILFAILWDGSTAHRAFVRLRTSKARGQVQICRDPWTTSLRARNSIFPFTQLLCGRPPSL